MIPEIYRQQLTSLAKAKGINLQAFAAIIKAESAWDPNAMRFEPTFSHQRDIEKYAKINKISADTEDALQSFSYGLCQIMGSNARKLLFRGPLVKILEPNLNMDLGTTFFQYIGRDYPKLEDQIAVYNAGSVRLLPDGKYKNQAYVDRVLRYMEEYSA